MMTFAESTGYDFGRPLSTFNCEPSLEDYILTVARNWQSPGTVGRELATLASTRVVTDELADDIAKTIREARKGYGQGNDAVLAMDIAELKMVADALGLELDKDVR
jgi:hypothetical protein